MGSHRTGMNLMYATKDGVQRARSLHGRTGGPTRRSTKGQWTPEEDEILRVAVQRYQGKSWKKIAECLEDRTDVQCLHRWQKVLNPELVKGPWSKEEDEVIIECVNRYGPKKWSMIAEHLPGRIGKQCRERWHNHLNPNINREAWTQDEELTLIHAHRKFGNKWAELSKFLPGRSDNAIKNHWHSSVKKRLERYFAPGLLSEVQGPALVTRPNYEAASTSSMAQQNSENDIVVKDEVEEVSECSQASLVPSLSQYSKCAIKSPVHQSGGCQVAEESSHFPCLEGYKSPSLGITFSIPQVPCDQSGNSEHDFNLEWQTFMQEDWKSSSNDLPDISLLDLGQESSGLSIPCPDSSANHGALHFAETSMDLGASGSTTDMAVGFGMPNLISNSDFGMVYRENVHDGCLSSDNISTDVSEPSDLLLQQPSNFQMHEDGNFASQSFYMAPERLGTSFTQPLTDPAQIHVNDPSHMLRIHPNNHRHSMCENVEQEPTSPIADNGFAHAMESAKLVSANDYIMERQDTSRFCSPKDKILGEKDKQKDSRALSYKSPRFPSFDIPFFSCDLLQSGNDMHQDFSPLGIRKLTISPMAPFKMWDSPSRDNSLDAILQNDLKSFAGTPSILKKRHRHLVSPLSEKRCEKKHDAASRKISNSNLSNDLFCLESLFNECIDQREISLSPSRRSMQNSVTLGTEKENVAPFHEEQKNGFHEIVPISENKSPEHSGTSCSKKIAEQDDVSNVEAEVGGQESLEMVDDVNDLVYLTPDGFGIKSNQTTTGDQYYTKLDALSECKAVLSPAETSCISVVCSPRLCAKEDCINMIITTSLQSQSPSQEKNRSSSRRVVFGKNIFLETPLKRSVESPSSWKSPWFNTFMPGPRGVDTDITIEDIGYFLSPMHQSCDVTGLVNQFGENSAGAFANHQELPVDETSETVINVKCAMNQEAEKENNHSPNTQTPHQIISASKLMTEGRMLDFSECGAPGMGTGKSLSISYRTPHLLKGFR